MSYAPKNYSTDGGNRTVIGGVLEFLEGSRVVNFPGFENMSASDATTVAALREDFNALLEKLKEAGIMAPEALTVCCEDVTRNYENFEDAVAFANAHVGATITLNRSVTVEGQYSITARTTIVLNGRTLASATGAHLLQVFDGATLTIDGTAEGSAVYGRLNAGKDTNDNGNIVINGGSYSCRSGQTCLHVNNTCTNSSITITDAVIASPNDNAIQLGAAGVHTIIGCTISGKTGIYLKGGTLTLTDSTVTSLSAGHTDYRFNVNGAYSTGDAIVVESCGGSVGVPVLNCGSGNTVSVVADSGNAQIAYYEKEAGVAFGIVVSADNALSVNDGYIWTDGDEPGTFKLAKAS